MSPYRKAGTVEADSVEADRPRRMPRRVNWRSLVLVPTAALVGWVVFLMSCSLPEVHLSECMNNCNATGKACTDGALASLEYCEDKACTDEWMGFVEECVFDMLACLSDCVEDAERKLK